ncbi:hypothetical protein ACJMK2_019571 [Sinanodonta woodiana]|uniref:SCP domain-containing protein n=1 Tax=Sinanodonta woodiana TaxID=1069815 RepID=A0ABD3TW62_SINWO
MTASENSAAENTTILRNRREAVYCKDRYKQWPDHSMCLPRKSQIVSRTDQQDIIRVHNKYRSNVTPPAEDMLKMDWDKELAEIAQRWADNCKMTHDTNAQRLIPGRFPVGQNIASSPMSLTWPTVIELWYNETTSFQYGVPTDLMKIGHFTQVRNVPILIMQQYSDTFTPVNCTMGKDHQSCGTSPFTANTCSTNTGTVQYCPELCKVCPYAGIDYKEKDAGSHKDTDEGSKSTTGGIAILPEVIVLVTLVALVTM